MTLLVTGEREMYHFDNLDDTILWMNMHPEEKVTIVPDDEYDEDFQMFLEYNAPFEIVIEKAAI